MPELEAAAEGIARDLVAALEVFEQAERLFYPGIAPRLRDLFLPFSDRLKKSKEAFEEMPVPSGSEEAHKRLAEAAGLCMDALDLSSAADRMEQFFVHFRKAGRRISRAQETIYPLHRLIPSVNRYFLEAPLHERAAEFLREPHPPSPSGLIHLGLDEEPYARGSCSLYIPESWDGLDPLPLVVALHGGFGHGRDFIWTWLREARSRRFILAAPSSRGITWSIMGPDFDGPLIHALLEAVTGRWNVDAGRMLLTGLSDGATYALKRALDDTPPFDAFAPVSGVLPPFDLRWARRRRIRWIHGARDWMFPILQAKRGFNLLREAGADVTQTIVEDLYHAYPREQNDGILTWFDPSLALAAPQP